MLDMYTHIIAFLAPKSNGKLGRLLPPFLPVGAAELPFLPVGAAELPFLPVGAAELPFLPVGVRPTGLSQRSGASVAEPAGRSQRSVASAA